MSSAGPTAQSLQIGRRQRRRQAGPDRPSSNPANRRRSNRAGRRLVRRAGTFPGSVRHPSGPTAGRRRCGGGLLQPSVNGRPQWGWTDRHRRRGCVRRHSGALQHLRPACGRPVGCRSGIGGSGHRGCVFLLLGRRHQPRSGHVVWRHRAPVDRRSARGPGRGPGALHVGIRCLLRALRISTSRAPCRRWSQPKRSRSRPPCPPWPARR